MKGLAHFLEQFSFKTAKRIVIFLLGISVILVGVVLLVIPGPGLLTIVIGLAILATEFLWARRLLRKLKQSFHEAGRRFPQGYGNPFRRDSPNGDSQSKGPSEKPERDTPTHPKP